MGSISTGVGLISGIDTANLINSLMAIESRGKLTLQARVARLEAEKAAFLDINTRLQALKASASGFRDNDIFNATVGSASNPDILGVTTSAGAQPGSFTFIVKQLVSTSQKLSQGFADPSLTPLGLNSLSFEFGKGVVARDTDLADLNGGAGVDRGTINITDKDGNTAEIDLTDVTSINEVLDRINTNGVADVTATVVDRHLVITDNTGGAGNLVIEDGLGDTTATDLGIVADTGNSFVDGLNIYTADAGTALSALNDGNGVLIRDYVADLNITARDGTNFDVDFGRIDAAIELTTALDDLNNGNGVTISSDSGNPDIQFVDKTGTEHDVDLTGVTTVGGLISRVSSETGGQITISIHADGDKLVVTDNSAGGGLLKVLGAGSNGNATAEDLGILNEAGEASSTFDGQVVPNAVSQAEAVTLGDIVDRINNATGNAVTAQIVSDRILLTDTTGGGGNLIVASTAANPTAASDLGIEANVAAASIFGEFLISDLNSVLARNLNGGAGLQGGSSLTLTDRDGDSVVVSNLDTLTSLSDIIDKINSDITGAGNVDVKVGLNSSGNGLLVTDTSGGAGNLQVAGDASGALGITADVAEDSVHGQNLQLRYVSEAASLADLNYGRGVEQGSFRITDGLGNSANISVGSDAKTLYDVILEINSRGLAVQARVNDNGDGLIIEEDLSGGGTPFAKIKVEAVSGSTAADLNIIGEAAEVTGANAFIDGSYERTVDVTASDSLNDIVSKINAAGVPVSASVINTGSGSQPYHLNFTSGISGSAGELIIDTGGVDIGLTTLAEGQDAKVFFGSENPEDGFLLTSSTNSLDDLISGVTIDLLQASDEAVTVTIGADDGKVTEEMNGFVTALNEIITAINLYDFYDVDSEEKGILLGSSVTARVRDSLYRTLQQEVTGIDTQYRYLSQVGITIGDEGVIELDETKFAKAYEDDPEAVENLFTALESSGSTTEEILPGVTVTNTTQAFNVQGVGQLFEALMEALTDSVNGTLTLASKNLDSQISLANKRIEDFDVRLASKRARLEAQFNAMELALAQLQAQGGALNGLVSNVALAQSSGVA